MALASFKGKYVVLEPTDGSEVPPNSIYVDSGTNQMVVKESGGGSAPITGDSTTYFVKEMVIESAISQHQPVSKKNNGKIVAGDSDAPDQNFIGYAQGDGVSDGDKINVLLVGPNVVGALDGLGFLPGDVIYISNDVGEYVNTTSVFGPSDKIVKVGIADCAAGVSGSVAVDLISFAERLIEPT